MPIAHWCPLLIKEFSAGWADSGLQKERSDLLAVMGLLAVNQRGEQEELEGVFLK